MNMGWCIAISARQPADYERWTVEDLDFGLAQLRLPVTPEAATIDSLSEGDRAAATCPTWRPSSCWEKSIDARTDIHAAGLVLYEMAQGNIPLPMWNVRN